MAATAAVNRPAQARPNGGNLFSCPSSGVPNSGQQEQGLQGTRQDPGPPSNPQHLIPPRPIFYVPPPPPFLQYQWPMPFSYNPFAGFPGMGYGMVMPPFPPPPYMEAPAYILPQPHVQPVDYRRLLHSQVHAPNAPYQNPQQTRRIHLPHNVRETVNSAVQTEPTQRGICVYGDGLDSGHGTASNSPSSSSSSSQKQGSAEVENYMLTSSNATDLKANQTCQNAIVKHGFNIPHPAGTQTVQKCQKDNVGQVSVPPYRNSHCNLWSISSPDSVAPVCSSSQQEDEVVKERRVSFPDILMSWVGGTPRETIPKMTEKVLSHNDHEVASYETELQHVKSVYQSPTKPKTDSVVADSADDTETILSSRDTLVKILKRPSDGLLSEIKESEIEPLGLFSSKQPLPYRDESLSLNKSYQLPHEQENGNETNPHEDATDVTPYQISLNSCQIKRKMNESVWSVESIAPFIPAKEWLLQKGTFEPEIIIELTEEAEIAQPSNEHLNAKAVKERRWSRRFSSPDSVPLSDSWLHFSTPAMQSPSKKPEMHRENDASEIRRQSDSKASVEKKPLVSLIQPCKINLTTPAKEDVDENRSFVLEANRSPNQDSSIVNEHQEKKPCSHNQKETLLLNSKGVEKISSTDQLTLQNGDNVEVEDKASRNEEVSKLRDQELCAPMSNQKMAKVSLSKGHLVDTGTQCADLRCRCMESNSRMGPHIKKSFDCSDVVEKANGEKAEGFGMNGHVQKNQRRHGQRKNRGQGGNGRNPQY